VHTGYDPDRQVSRVTADGIAQDTIPTYDPVKGRLTLLAFSGGTDAFAYDSTSGRLSSITTADGITLSYGFDGPLLKTTTWAGPVAGSVARTYDADFRLSTETVAGGSPVSFGYDNDALLTSAGALTITRSNGNRLTAPNITTSPVYDAQDRLTSYGDCTYGYKADGSLQTKTCPDGATTYDYDSFGNLRHVTLPNGTAIDYLIDGQNRRIGKKLNGVMVEGFLYRNQLQPAAWLNGDGTVKARFVYGGKPNVPEYMVTSAGAIYRIITDQVGSVRLVVDTASDAVAERLEYDEFGNILSDSAPGTLPFGFSGGIRDDNTNIPKEDLDNADVHVGEMPWYTPGWAAGITRGNDIYFRDPNQTFETPEDMALLGHELVHVGQYRKGMTWLSYLWRARHGYDKSPDEEEAYRQGAIMLSGLRTKYGARCSCSG